LAGSIRGDSAGPLTGGLPDTGLQEADRARTIGRGNSVGIGLDLRSAAQTVALAASRNPFFRTEAGGPT
jgi:hypothetical protein